MTFTVKGLMGVGLCEGRMRNKTHTTDKLLNWFGNPHRSTKGYPYLSIHSGL